MSKHRKHDLYIENLRNHPAKEVERLRHLLKSGAKRREDPRHPNFFEVDDRHQVFYIHVSPVTEQIIFLATWARDARDEPSLQMVDEAA